MLPDTALHVLHVEHQLRVAPGTAHVGLVVLFVPVEIPLHPILETPVVALVERRRVAVAETARDLRGIVVQRVQLPEPEG